MSILLLPRHPFPVNGIVKASSLEGRCLITNRGQDECDDATQGITHQDREAAREIEESLENGWRGKKWKIDVMNNALEYKGKSLDEA
jgi:hypothetical protein